MRTVNPSYSNEDGADKRGGREERAHGKNVVWRERQLCGDAYCISGQIPPIKWLI